MNDDYWREIALAPTCQEERDAVNKGPEGEEFFMRDDREIGMEIGFVDQEIERMQKRRDGLIQEYREARENRIGGEYERDDNGVWRCAQDFVGFKVGHEVKRIAR
jgi:hypothetical protein